MDLWVLAGQSNMQGLGLLSDPRRSSITDPRVESLTSAGTWEVAADPLHRLWESFTPVHTDLLRRGLSVDDVGLENHVIALRERNLGRFGTGLGVSFGHRWVELTGRSVGLIPCAHGGTTLAQWSGFGSGAADSRTLHGAMLTRIRVARERDGSVLRGVLWYQGESDADPQASADYGRRFAAWVGRVRRDLALPDLPVYTVQLGRLVAHAGVGDGTERSRNAIREFQRRIPHELPRSGVVSAIDLSLSDVIHIDAPSQQRLGRRLALVASRGTTGPDVESVEFAGIAVNNLCRLGVRCSGVSERWLPASRIPGFELTREEGDAPCGVAIVDSHVDPADPTSLVVITDAIDPEHLSGLRLSYGQGLDPICNLVDVDDLPLPAVGPQAILFEGSPTEERDQASEFRDWIAALDSGPSPRERPDVESLRRAVSARPNLEQVEIMDMSIEGGGVVPARSYVGQTPRAALVWVHGGAFIGGDLDMPEAAWTAINLAQAGVAVLSIDYRKAVDGVHYPAPRSDVLQAWLWACVRGATEARRRLGRQPQLV